MNDELGERLLAEVRQMRVMLELLAEPAIAQRDAKLRDELRKAVGNSAKMAGAVLLMDGSRTQAEIVAQASAHQGNLSTLVGKLEQAGLLADGKKRPKLVISIPSNFFDGDAKSK